MIDAAVFVAEMEILQQRFGYARDFTPEFLDRYRAYLSERMTTDQFRAAARVVFEAFDSWPSPQRFAQTLTGDPDQRATDAWNALYRAARDGNPDAVAPESLAVLRSIGATYRDVETSDEYAIRRLSRQFYDEHRRLAHVDAPQQLPAEPRQKWVER